MGKRKGKEGKGRVEQEKMGGKMEGRCGGKGREVWKQGRGKGNEKFLDPALIIVERYHRLCLLEMLLLFANRTNV